MKKKYYLVCFILSSVLAKAQNHDNSVGILTLNPEATLDVNGNVKVRNVPSTNASNIDKVLVLDSDTNIIKAVDKNDLIRVSVTRTKIYTLIQKGSSQILPVKGDYFPVEFTGSKSGLNNSEIIISSDATELTFPPNKTIKVSGSIGILYKSPSEQKEFPAYITTKFEQVGSSMDVYFSSQGYTESSTEKYDDGGVTDPIILFNTGSSGGTIRLMARYSGGDSPEGGYYLAGTPTSQTIGTFIIIQEL